MILQEWLVYWAVIIGLFIILWKSKKLLTAILLMGILLLLEFTFLGTILDEGVSYQFTPVVANTTESTDPSTNITTTAYAYEPWIQGSLSPYFTEWPVIAVIALTVLAVVYKWDRMVRGVMRKGGG